MLSNSMVTIKFWDLYVVRYCLSGLMQCVQKHQFLYAVDYICVLGGDETGSEKNRK